MAKILEGKDGAHMLVSDDAPDEIDIGIIDIGAINSSWSKETSNNQVESKPPPSSANILLHFLPTSSEEPLTVTVQVEKFVIDNERLNFKLIGTILLEDYAWLLENISLSISIIKFRAGNNTFNVINGPIAIATLSAKDINATTAKVNLSLKKYI